MKKVLVVAGCCLWLLACAGKETNGLQDADCSGLQKGALLAEDSTRVAEEKLNDFYFSVRLIATGIKGRYEVQAACGPNDGSSLMLMPRGGESFCPEMRRVPDVYSYEIGFRQGNDPAFYPYFMVSWVAGQLVMRYTAAYTLEAVKAGK